MYPDTLFLGLTLYDIFILVGVVAAFLLADRMTVKSGFSVTLQKIVIVCALSCVIVGYGSCRRASSLPCRRWPRRRRIFPFPSFCR